MLTTSLWFNTTAKVVIDLPYFALGSNAIWCDYGHFTRSISTRRGWWLCGEKRCLPAR